MTTFYLIRHGAKQHPTEDKFLIETGVKQAELTGDFLQDKNITALYASPLNRTQQTAKIITKFINLPIITDKRLRERINMGDRENETFEEFIKEWDKTQLDRNYIPPNGDSSFGTGERIKAVLEEVAQENKTIAVVTHGGAIGDFLMNTFAENQLEFSIDPDSNARYIEISECSITEVVKSGNKFILKKFGDASHLPTPVI